MEKEEFKAVIDRQFPFEQIVEAYKNYEKGQKIRNAVISAAH